MLECLFNKVTRFKTPTQVLSCEIHKHFTNTYFEEHLLKAAFDFKPFSSLKSSFEEILMIFNKEWKSVLS